MKFSLVLLGLLIAAGLLGGAYILSTSKTNGEEYANKMETANEHIDNLTKKTALLEGNIAQLHQELESCKLVIESNGNRIGQMTRQLAEAPQPVASPALPAGKTGDSISGQSPPMPEVIEAVKEEVKKELKEEKLAKETEQFQNWYKQMHKSESEKFRKQMEDDFPALAQKIKLTPTQEYAIRDVAEGAFKKIMALIEDTMANRSKEEIDWVAYQKQMEEIYNEAETQIVELVDEKQAGAIRKFFEDEDPRKR